MQARAAMLIVVSLAACSQRSGEPASNGGVAVLPQVAAEVSTPVEVDDPGPTSMIDLSAGAYEPLFPGRDAPEQVPVASFRLEKLAVSNAQFLAFVAAKPKWQRGRAPRLFVDAGYLTHWLGPTQVPEHLLDRPVINVSWFAARAYARWRERRLPTIAEWEYAAAMPLVGGRDASQEILAWYGRPGGADLGAIGSGFATVAGIGDLHGLIWEWVEDFSSAMVSGDGRSNTDFQRSLFCGAGAVGSARPENYAAFMRFAMRSSLKSESSTRNLGFRCAQDIVVEPGTK